MYRLIFLRHHTQHVTTRHKFRRQISQRVGAKLFISFSPDPSRWKNCEAGNDRTTKPITKLTRVTRTTSVTSPWSRQPSVPHQRPTQRVPDCRMASKTSKPPELQTLPGNTFIHFHFSCTTRKGWQLCCHFCLLRFLSS